MKLSNKNRDVLLYGVIGGLSAAQACIANGDLPKSWAPWIAVAIGITIAIKAKLSQTKKEVEEEILPENNLNGNSGR